MARQLDTLAELLAVDEIRVDNNVGGWIVALRLGDKWVSAEIDLKDIAGVRDKEAEIGRTCFALAAVLKEGRAQPPAPKEPEPTRSMNRFEALAEELKKS